MSKNVKQHEQALWDFFLVKSLHLPWASATSRCSDICFRIWLMDLFVQ